jgi:hypothetical protein
MDQGSGGIPRAVFQIHDGHAAPTESSLDLMTARQCGRELPGQIHGHAHFAKGTVMRLVTRSAANVRLPGEGR